jgi:hypothetical protein
MLVSRLLNEAVDKFYPKNRIKSEIVEQYMKLFPQLKKQA